MGFLSFLSVKFVAGLVLGGLAGYLWYRYVGCITGSCPITANPYISTIYGMTVGGFLAWG